MARVAVECIVYTDRHENFPRDPKRKVRIAVTACAADIRHGFSHYSQFMPRNIICASTCNLPGFRYSAKRSTGIYTAGNHRYADLRGTAREQRGDERR